MEKGQSVSGGRHETVGRVGEQRCALHAAEAAAEGSSQGRAAAAAPRLPHQCDSASLQGQLGGSGAAASCRLGSTRELPRSPAQKGLQGTAAAPWDAAAVGRPKQFLGASVVALVHATPQGNSASVAGVSAAGASAAARRHGCMTRLHTRPAVICARWLTAQQAEQPPDAGGSRTAVSHAVAASSPGTARVAAPARQAAKSQNDCRRASCPAAASQLPVGLLQRALIATGEAGGSARHAAARPCNLVYVVPISFIK
jgi:hypothetical protein